MTLHFQRNDLGPLELCAALPRLYCAFLVKIPPEGPADWLALCSAVREGRRCARGSTQNSELAVEVHEGQVRFRSGTGRDGFSAIISLERAACLDAFARLELALSAEVPGV